MNSQLFSISFLIQLHLIKTIKLKLYSTQRCNWKINNRITAKRYFAFNERTNKSCQAIDGVR